MSKFNTGALLVSSGVQDQSDKDAEFRKFVKDSFVKYSLGDWSDATPKSEAELNEKAIANENDAILAAYKDTNLNAEIWFLTDEDRKTTTVMFPEEY